MIPTNEQIEEKATEFGKGFADSRYFHMAKSDFTRGATWMKEQMLSGVHVSFESLYEAEYIHEEKFGREAQLEFYNAIVLSCEKRLADNQARISELESNLSFVEDNYSRVIDECTNGLLSKPNTPSSVVIDPLGERRIMPMARRIDELEKFAQETVSDLLSTLSPTERAKLITEIRGKQ